MATRGSQHRSLFGNNYKKTSAFPLSMKSIKVVNESSNNNIVLLAEHSGKGFPGGYGTLGIEPEVLETISDYYDNGARPIIERLAEVFDATAIYSNFSRLLIDLNRALDHHQLIRVKEDDWGIIIPGNDGISEEERQKRIKLYWDPYHRKVKEVVEKKLQQHERVFVFVIHTCSAWYNGDVRDFDCDVMFKHSEVLAKKFGTSLANKGYKIQYNEPYSADQSCTMKGYLTPKVEWLIIETNQKTIARYAERNDYIVAVGEAIKESIK